jgi:hypothetical protein
MDDRGPSPEINAGSTRAARLLRRGMMLILGALALCVAAPAMASATTPGWELNELPLTESAATAWSGNLKVTDSNVPIIGKEAVECETTAAGTAGVLNVGTVTSWTSSKCVTVEGCEKATLASPDSMVALHLPWDTELAVVEGHQREVAVSGGSGTPGFEVICKIFGAVTNDQCLGTISLNTKNVTAGVSAEFVGGEDLKCSASGTTTGSLAGTQSITSSGGKLSAQEGLGFGWIRNGKPIAEKEPAKWYGAVTLSDSITGIGTVSVHCEDSGAGSVGATYNGEITSATMSGCSGGGGSGGCEVNGASIEAINLPWHTELATIEGKINDAFKTTKNGFKLKCKVAGVGNITDECPVIPKARITNASRDVTATFNREKFSCSLGQSGGGSLEGSETTELTAGGDLWAA